MKPPEKTVCVFAPTANGGHARYAWELTSALARHPRGDFAVELVSSCDLEEPFRDADYPVHAFLPTLRPRSDFRTRLSWASSRLAHYPVRERQFLRWLSRRPDVEVVHFQEWKPWLAAGVLRRIRRMGKRVFYTVHNVLPHRYPTGVPKRLMHHWIRRACQSCDGLFVHTERLAEELAQFLGERRPPITVVPHGVWTVDAPKPEAEQGPALAERLAWKRLLFFGAIRRNKGLDLFLRAAEQLRDYRITIAGEPCEAEYFRSEVVPRVRSLRGAGVEVELIDRFVADDEVGPLFARHSAIVLPYTREFVAQSGVVFLALAYGLPVVASHAGGLRDLLGQYEIGTSFETGSAEELARAVARLHDAANAPALERNIGAARRRFTWQAAAGATLAGYAAVAHASGERDRERNDCAVGTTAVH